MQSLWGGWRRPLVLVLVLAGACSVNTQGIGGVDGAFGSGGSEGGGGRDGAGTGGAGQGGGGGAMGGTGGQAPPVDAPVAKDGTGPVDTSGAGGTGDAMAGTGGAPPPPPDAAVDMPLPPPPDMAPPKLVQGATCTADGACASG